MVGTKGGIRRTFINGVSCERRLLLRVAVQATSIAAKTAA
jgi:hypothetical protein